MNRIYVPKWISENAVLQYGKQNKIWGYVTPHSEVELSFCHHSYHTIADGKGYFEISFICDTYGGPFPLSIYAKNHISIILHHIYIGEVYLCMGQSNMELPMERVKERYPDEPGASYVHQYKVEECTEFTSPLSIHNRAAWTICEGIHLQKSTALGYFLGKILGQHFKVPIGIINVSKGGSPIQSWMSRDALKAYPPYLHEADLFADESYRNTYFTSIAHKEQIWQSALDAAEKEYLTQGLNIPYQEINLPNHLYDNVLRGFSGLAEFTKEFCLEDGEENREWILKLGTLVDSDKSYINNIYVGETTYRFPPRIYPIAKGILKSGKNTVKILLRVRDGEARFTLGKQMRLVSADSYKELSGTWQYRIIKEVAAADEMDFIIRKATSLYHGMLAPCIPMSIKAIIWYQGESNDKNPNEYKGLLQAFIQDLRDKWDNENLPFFIVQLPFCDIDINKNQAWPILRIAQKSMEKIPFVHTVTTLDLGEPHDLHPLNKKEIAYRLSLYMRAHIYKEDITCSAGELLSYERTENGIILYFSDTLTIEGETCDTLWEISPDNIRYVPASFQILGRQVYVYGKDISYLRYVWANAVPGEIIRGGNGLPISPLAIGLDKGEFYEIV